MVVLQVSGNITINLQDLTNNFLPSFHLNLGTINWITSFESNNPLGLRPGVYMTVRGPKILKFLRDLLGPMLKVESMVDSLFGKELKKSKDLKDNEKLTFGHFIDNDAIGFKFEAYSFKFECIYELKKRRGSCNCNNKFVNGVVKVIAGVAKLFVAAGDSMFADVSTAAKNFVAGADKAGHAFAKGAEEAGDAVAKGTSEAASGVEKGADYVGSGIYNAGHWMVSGF